MNRQTTIYLILFILDVWALSSLLAAWRTFWGTKEMLPFIRLVLTAIWFFVLFGALGYLAYLGEKKKGRLTRRVALYEWLESRGWRLG